MRAGARWVIAGSMLVTTLVGTFGPGPALGARDVGRRTQQSALGTVVAWGANNEGQTAVPAGLSGVTAVAAGTVHNLALRADGTVVAFGADTFGAATVPPGLGGVTAVAAGAYHSLALRADGRVVAWGENASGQSTVPPGLAGVQAIAAGDRFSLTIRGFPVRVPLVYRASAAGG